ncbi:unnamed protein product [Polarella glacialis]|uniref:ubiquitinyl hydrolase 1 n=1 Tax=Polarella glacialis TaxID=89957 RepID=A0A813D1W7_POLGL|nr:unnamed protein product [Polarella glacialis]
MLFTRTALLLCSFHRRGSRWEKSSGSVDLPALLDLSEFVLTEELHANMKPHLASESAKDMDIPLLTEGSETKHEYELYGLCVHQGSALQSGHYVAFVNAGPSLAREDWFGSSDTKVWRCPRSEALKAEAYLAFYRRVKAEAPADGSDAEDESESLAGPTEEAASEAKEEAEVEPKKPVVAPVVSAWGAAAAARRKAAQEEAAAAACKEAEAKDAAAEEQKEQDREEQAEIVRPEPTQQEQQQEQQQQQQQQGQEQQQEQQQQQDQKGGKEG